MVQIVMLDAATLADTSLSPLLHANWQFDSFANTSLSERLQRCQHADVIISNKVPLDRALLSQCPKLQLICVAATGTNNVDIDAAAELGIVVCNVRDYALDAVPQHAMALMLALNNQIVQNHHAVKSGLWSQSLNFCLHQQPIHSLQGKTLTVVGYGGLGQATARLAQAFGMQLCIAERPDAEVLRPGRTAFRQALMQADVVSLHCPAIPGAGYLLGALQLSWLKPSALLINTARGALVDPVALLQALTSKQLAGAALDVLPEEPPAFDHALVQSTLPNLLLSPHIAWATQEAMQQLVLQVRENIDYFFAGTPLRICPPSGG